MDNYIPKFWHVLACILFTLALAMLSPEHFHGWHSWLVCASLVLTALLLFMLVYTNAADNICAMRDSAARLIEQVRDVDDHRLRTIGIHFPEWHIRPLAENSLVQFTLEDTSITREFFIKFMKHPETNNVQMAPVRSFPQRGGQQVMATELHKLAHRNKWAEPWGGNQTSKWCIGWGPARLLVLYGCDEEMVIPDLAEVEAA